MSYGDGFTPAPNAYPTLRAWAEALHDHLQNPTRLDQRNDPIPVQLAHRSENFDERAGEDGVLLYDPLTKKLVISIDGAYVPILLEDDVAISQFGELLTAQRSPLIELNSAYGTSLTRDVETTSGSATIGAANGEITLSTGTTASSVALLESAEAGRYVPGFAAEIGIGMRFPAVPTGNEHAEWGGVDATTGPNSGSENGFWFGYDATGVYIAYANDGVVTKTYQSSWNKDKLDGTGASGVTLDMSAGNIFQIEFTWYGYGEITFKVVKAAELGKQKPIKVHALNISGSTSIENPNLYLFAESNNGGDTTDYVAYVGGRSYTILGIYVPARRITSERRLGVSTSTTRVPLVTFRRKSGFLDRSLRVSGFDTLATSENCIVDIVLNGTLTGASYGTPTNHIAGECAVEADTSATAISGGLVLYSRLVASGQPNNAVLGGPAGPLEDLEIPRDQPVSLVARTTSGTGSISSVFRVKEEW